MEIIPEHCHDLLYDTIKQKLAYSENNDYESWKADLRKKFIELVGIENIQKNACPLNINIEEQVKMDGYIRIKYTFESEKGAIVPCYLCIPDTGKKKYPVVITLQGHTTGFHNSVGIIKFDSDKDYQPRGQFALQAVKRGYASLSIEQRGLGIRRPTKPYQKNASMCEYEAHIALLLGRTILGERIWDVSKAIDTLETFHNLDLSNLIITGNSGGGTMSYYASCYDDRIKISAPSCAFCTYRHSIMHAYHCSCNFIPHAYEWFEMHDLACLIAPRKLMIITGEQDAIFPIDGVKKAFSIAEKIYKKARVSNNIHLAITPKAHWWCEDIVWDNIDKLYKESIAK